MILILLILFVSIIQCGCVKKKIIEEFLISVEILIQFQGVCFECKFKIALAINVLTQVLFIDHILICDLKPKNLKKI